MKGEHVIRHIPGLWNGFWSDLHIETTFMRYGHCPGGIIDITLKPEHLKTWALGLDICSRLEQDLHNLTNEEHETTQEVHIKERGYESCLMQLTEMSLGENLSCVSTHPQNILNNITGQIACDTVTIPDALCIGKKQMKDYEKT